MDEKTPITDVKQDVKYIKAAIKESRKSLISGDVPVGCVIADENGKIIARAHNEREKTGDSTAHAEVLAIRKASKKLGRWNLTGCTMYVTLEPCVMCSGAAVNARISRIVFGAYDKRFGCCGTVYNLACDQNFNHRCEVTGGIEEGECIKEVQNFFKTLRKSKKSESERLNS